MTTHDVQKKKEDVSDFEPSPKRLSKIVKILFEYGSIGRTKLSLKTKINYQIVSEHISWLESQGFIEFKIISGKMLVDLSESGREFAHQLASLPY